MQPAVSLICSRWPLGRPLEVWQGFRVHCFTRTVLSADLCGSKRFALANHCRFLLGLLLFFPLSVARKHSAMIWRRGQHVTAKQAAFDAMISPVESNPSTSAANSSLPSTDSADPSATSQSPMSDQPSPTFLAAVVSAVKQALAAEQTSNLPSTPSLVLLQACQWRPRSGAFLVRVRLSLPLANSMPKPQAWQPLALVFRRSHRLFPLPQSKLGPILLYLLLLLHVPHW